MDDEVLVHAACTVPDFFSWTNRVQQVQYMEKLVWLNIFSRFVALSRLQACFSVRFVLLVSLPGFFPMIFSSLRIQVAVHGYDHLVLYAVNFGTAFSILFSFVGAYIPNIRQLENAGNSTKLNSVMKIMKLRHKIRSEHYSYRNYLRRKCRITNNSTLNDKQG